MKTAGQPAVFMLENGGDNKSKPMSHLGNGVPVQSGHVAIPGSKNPDHIRDNFDIFDFALTDEEMAEIAKLDKGVRYYYRTDEQLKGFAAWHPEFEAK